MAILWTCSGYLAVYFLKQSVYLQREKKCCGANASFPNTINGTNHPRVVHRMLEDEEVSEVTVYTLPQGNGSASDEDSVDEKEEASHIT